MTRAETRPPRRMSDAAIAETALAYLARFASSSGNLRRLLARKAAISAAHYGDDLAPLLAAIDALIARYRESGVLDDAHYARTQAAKLRRRGGSARVIAGRLVAKGVEEAVIAEIFVGESTDAPAPDQAAAAAYAKRRRLGPFRSNGGRDEHRLRDLAALGRAGFDYAVAVAVIDAAGPEAPGTPGSED